MSDPTHTAAVQFWDREGAAPTHVSWMADPAVRAYINRSISGSPHTWPIDWFVEWLHGARFERGVSIGCGTGPLERDLIRRGLCMRIDAFDSSPRSIEVARDLARQEGVADRVTYALGDFNDPKLQRGVYDIAFFHQSAHHVAKLEKLFSNVLRALKPDGVVYLDEYVGPSRFDWNDDLIAPHRRFFDRIPREARLVEQLPLMNEPEDPSEALRSNEIIAQLRHGFTILERRDYGGTLLSVIFPYVDWSRAPTTLVDNVIEAEKELLRSGHPHYHAIVVAAPKRGWPRLYGRIRYFVAPKLRRIRWEIAKRLSPHRTVKF